MKTKNYIMINHLLDCFQQQKTTNSYFITTTAATAIIRI